MGQQTKHNTGMTRFPKRAVDMVKITKEGKEINEKNQRAFYGWYYRLCNQTPQLPIQFIFKPNANSISNRVPWGLSSITGNSE
jgi:hypothetical protein